MTSICCCLSRWNTGGFIWWERAECVYSKTRWCTVGSASQGLAATFMEVWRCSLAKKKKKKKKMWEDVSLISLIVYEEIRWMDLMWWCYHTKIQGYKDFNHVDFFMGLWGNKTWENTKRSRAAQLLIIHYLLFVIYTNVYRRRCYFDWKVEAQVIRFSQKRTF